MAISRRVTKTLTGADQWSDPLAMRTGAFYVAVTGTFSRRVTVQRSHDNGVTWTFVQALPAGGGPWQIENVVAGAWYRVGFRASDGDYASGTAEVELAQ